MTFDNRVITMQTANVTAMKSLTKDAGNTASPLRTEIYRYVL